MRTLSLKTNPLGRLFPRLGVGIFLLTSIAAVHGETIPYQSWAEDAGLTGDDVLPTANPDNDPYVNALEYVFNTDPLEPNSVADIGPFIDLENGAGFFIFRSSLTLGDQATMVLRESGDLESWSVAPGAEYDVEVGDYALVFHEINPGSNSRFYRLDVTVEYEPGFEVKVEVGLGVGDGTWDGLDPIITAYLWQQPPPASDVDDTPNTSKYPNVVGTDRAAVTPDLLADVTASGQRLRLRSWMGWFLWGDGTPPPGISAGYPVTDNYNGEDWDFFSFQYPAQTEDPAQTGAWKPIRLDQQPLYLNPFRVNNSWPAGQFGYKTKPLEPFPNQTKYWSQKRIVRGPNLSVSYPFFHQYGNRIEFPNYPDHWRESWFYFRTRPLETLTLVPSALKPDDLLQNGDWNNVGTPGSPVYEPYPYPVWNTNLPPKDQTPFAILTDRIGDWDADIVWQGTHPNADGYSNNRYRRTLFAEPGQGNYLKMSVAQGSPFIWCETHNNPYMIFYNLIRTNVKGAIGGDGEPLDTGSGAKMVDGGPWAVPGVDDVEFVLFYGDQNNPNQWYQEAEPWYWDGGQEKAGGYNPAGEQHNDTYIAVFYRTSEVEPVVLGAGGKGSTDNNGIDAQNNPYFYLEFKDSGKNWFVVGSIPVMRYYHTDVTRDNASARDAAAIDWAEEMGQYAFNFVTETAVSYDVEHMSRVTTTYETTLINPYVAAGDASAAAMTADPDQTVIALLPHHYQPLTLGPDLTQPGRPQVMWEPLQSYDADFPVPASAPPNANKNTPASSSRWGYWGPRGNMKPVVTGSFATQQLFQNFLPLTPPPAWEKEYDQSGIQAVVVTDTGSNYNKIENPVPNAEVKTAPGVGGSGARLLVLLEPNTGRVQQVDVIDGGAGYPDGNPPDPAEVWVEIDAPQIAGGEQATARLQIGGGRVLAVFMNEKGSRYQSVIEVDQPGVTYDEAIIVPNFSGSPPFEMLGGAANIITGGAGFDFSEGNQPTLTVVGTGTGATAQIAVPGTILSLGDAPVGGFTIKGNYPSTGDLAEDLAHIGVFLPPPSAGEPAQEAQLASLNSVPTSLFFVVYDRGAGYNSEPTAEVVDANGVTRTLGVGFDPGAGIVASVFIVGEPFPIDEPTEITFTGGSPTAPAKAKVFGGFSIDQVNLETPFVGGYGADIEASFSSAYLVPNTDVELPEFELVLDDNSGEITDVNVLAGGKGFTVGGQVEVRGGRGYNAMVAPILGPDQEILAVKVLRSGNGYLDQVYASVDDGGKQPGPDAELSVVVEDGRIVAVNVDEPGEGYVAPVIKFSSVAGGNPEIDSPKGPRAIFTILINEDGEVTGTDFIPPNDSNGENYLNVSFTEATVDSPPVTLFYRASPPFAQATATAQGYIGPVIQPSIKVEQVVYDSLVTGFTNYASESLRPFAGGFGGASAPDGYGLGNQLSAAAKWIASLYHLQQYAESLGQDQPTVLPSQFAYNAGNTPASAFEWDIYKTNHPIVTLSGALKTSVQALQRTLTLFHNGVPYANDPNPGTWSMEYFAQYDPEAGRVVINPTSTIPVLGVVSSVQNPPSMEAENADKEGLSVWKKGMLWSGFGVSDQWNDQHYFYGYYLGTAGLVSIFDRSWESSITGKPSDLWAHPDQIGTAIDQWLMTLAYDPDNTDLVNDLYTKSEFTYQKFSYFDQWSGHGWATGVSPGRAGDVEDGQTPGTTPVPWSIWLSYGTGSSGYDHENENSIFEGIQPWSATILWGAGTDRKSVVDLGIYLLTTEMAAADMYFLDKNYNLPTSADNAYSWAPVTTIDSADAINNGGNNSTPANTGFVESTADAFYQAPEFFGGASSAGTSILQKGSPSLNNFFFAFPTGSKFIQAYPPTMWTLGISRNSDYMRRWAGSMMREEWTEARDGSLFQPANWLAMAMSSTVAGVPYNPGDVPYPMTGTTPNPAAPDPYVGRIWSSWVTLNTAAGAEAPKQPAFTPVEVLSFFHILDEYGTPDWTYIGYPSSSGGAPDNDRIVFTAAFSKVNQGDSSVTTTFVAFNPGWDTAHATFHRLNTDGTPQASPVSPDMPLEVPAKKMVIQQMTIP